jgi:hypothetical protein
MSSSRLAASALFLSLASLLLGPSWAAPQTPQKLTAEDVVSHHLDSIGDAKARAAVTTRIISGTSQVIFRTSPTGQASGKAVLASDGFKNLIGMSFPSPVYPREQFGYDGNTFLAAYTVPGVRSTLGAFLMTHRLIFKQGLMGGTLSSAWPLLDPSWRGAKLEYKGLKKIDNRELQEIGYVARGAGDLTISLFFDAENFEHVRTEYNRVIAAGVGDRSMISAQGKETRYKLVEQFSDFRQEAGLMLPHLYEIRLSADSGTGSFLAEWTIKLTNFSFNEKIDPASFTISAD